MSSAVSGDDEIEWLELDDEWRCWSQAVLRGAGFSSSKLHGLADDELAARTDAFLAAEDAATDAGETLIKALREMRSRLEGPARTPISKAIKAAAKGRVPAMRAELEPVRPLIQDMQMRVEARDAAAEKLEPAYVDAFDRFRAAILDAARDPRFREALTWQNSAAVKVLDRLLAKPNASLNSERYVAWNMVANYLQRYCAKNDTIGFFGPCGWIRFAEGDDQVTLEPGSSLVSRREVFFEHWGMDVIAEMFSADPAIRPHLPPRVAPTVRLEGDTVHFGVQRKQRLPLEFARAMSAADGVRTARDIADELSADPDLDFEDADEVFEVFDELVDKGLLRWSLNIPSTPSYADRHLASALADIPGDAGERARATMAAFESARLDVAKAAGDPVALAAAIEALNELFEEVTDRAATRASGRMYAGRTLIYEECARDVRARIQTHMPDLFGRALGLILTSARWYTYEIARRYLPRFEEGLERLLDEHGVVPGVAILELLYETLPTAGQDFIKGDEAIEEVTLELHRKWREILGYDSSESPVVHSSDALADKVARAFPAPHPGWPSARHHSPDILFCGLDKADVTKTTVVLGELHASGNTLTAETFLKMSPNADDLVNAHYADVSEPVVFTAQRKDLLTKAIMTSPTRNYFELELHASRPDRDPEQIIPISEFVCERVDGRPVCRSLRTNVTFTPVQVADRSLQIAAVKKFSINPSAAQPRVTIDNLVVMRARWYLEPDAIGFATMPRGRERYVAARRWAKETGLPRRFFVKIPEETKPVYVDMNSPLYVDNFAQFIRKASVVSISEMLPTLDDAWLPDVDGNVYTSEIRIVAVDSKPYPTADGT